jgi:Zn finger protein HypA/HybF involved in hydrogenase expression
MIENIIIAVIVIVVVLLIVFCVGYVPGACLESTEIELDQQTDQQDIYCFQCEIEMPVKKKNSRLYCKNCGLRHQNF